MRSYRITSVWGIPIRINVSLVVFLPVLAWLIGSGQQIDFYAGVIDGLTGSTLDTTVLRQGSTPWVVGFAAAIGLFVSVTLHELGHSWVARRYGLPIESITLWIFGGVSAMPTIPREWNRELWIAVVGPVTSLLIGLGFYALLQVVPASLPVVFFVVGWLAVVNVTLAIFNLVPAFPMDGGRVLRALLARTHPFGQATQIAARIGVIFALLFAVIGVVTFNVVLVLVALFVYGAAKTESVTSALEESLEGLAVADVMDRNPPSVSADSTVAEFADRMLVDRRTEYTVTDGTGNIVGIVSLGHLKGRGERDRETTPVADVMSEEPPIVQATADAFDAFVELGRREVAYALVEEGGTIVGVLSQADYAAALERRRAIGESGGRGPP